MKTNPHILPRLSLGRCHLLGLALAVASLAHLEAAPIPINNFSFENPVLGSGGWNNTFPDWIGQAGSGNGNAFVEYIGGFRSEGNQHIGMQTGYYVFQNLGVPYQANTTYKLTVGVGYRNAGQSGTLSTTVIGLTALDEPPSDTNVLVGTNTNDQLANDTLLAASSKSVDSVALNNATALTFTDVTTEYTTTATPPVGNIVVFLGDDTNGVRSHFDNVRLEAVSALNPDGDNIPAEWETGTDRGVPRNLNPAVNDGALDFDGDTLTNFVEFQKGTHPRLADTDADGINDNAETATDPLNPDGDGDTLLDGAEVAAGTNPNDTDSDDDSFEDQAEKAAGTNPLAAASKPSNNGDILLGVNFEGGNATSNGAQVTTQAGKLPQANWINAPGGSGGPLSTVNSAGTPSILRVSWKTNGPSIVGAEPPAGEGNARLMHGILRPRGTAAVPAGDDIITEITVRNIAYPTFDLYLYLNSETGGQAVFTANGETITVSNILIYDGSFVDVPGDNGEGNVLHFANVTGPTLTITQTMESGGIAGLQIVRATGDTDGDGMPDLWEDNNGTNKNVPDAGLDPDLDSSTNLQEFQRLTNPQNPDSDNDTLKDGWETKTGTYVSATNTGTDPLKPDTDGDGLTDGVEKNTGTFVDASNPGSNPTKADTDGDGANDGAEATLGTNPNSAASVASVISGAGQWDTEMVYTRSTPQLNDVAGAEAVLDAPGTFPAADSIKLKTSYVHFHDNSAPPWFVAQSKPYPLFDQANGGTGFGDREDFAIRSKGKIKITKPGMVWFDANTDDGFVLRIDGVEIGTIGNRGRADTLMSVDLTAGLHDVEFVHWERGGGAGVSLLVYRAITDQQPAVDGNTWQLLEIFLDVADTDGDGMLDSYEIANGLNPAVNDAAADKDGDTLSNLTESQRGTRADKVDTDSDGLNDNVETNTGTYVSATNTGTNPLKADTDADGLVDGAETNTGTFVSATNTGTSPVKKDTDGDTFGDGDELIARTNPTSAASKPPLPIPLGYWPFDDKDPVATEDITLGAHDGTLLGTAVYVAGHTGNPGDFAIEFNGTDTGVNSGASLLNGAPAFTMSGWVNFTASQAARTALFGQNDVVEFGMIDLDTLELWNPTGGAVQFGFGPATNGWQHIAVVADGTGRRIYIDGVLAVSGSVGTPAATSADRFNIGYAVADATGNFYNGMIDDVAVWNTALTADIIAKLASGELTPLPLSAPVTPPAITSFSYNPGTSVLNLTFSSVPGSNYALEYTIGFLPAGAPTSAQKWNVVPGYSSIPASAGTTTSITPLNTSTLVTPNGQLPNNSQSNFRIRKQ